MNIRLATWLLNLLLCLLPGSLLAQQPKLPILETLDSTFFNYTASRQSPDLFLHLDKTVYVKQENIWFTAYLLNMDPIVPQHTLHTLLVEDATQKIVAAERFVLEAGTGKGCIFLPDSLRAGEYRLIAYTNSYFNHPQQPIFQQALALRTAENNPFKLSFLPPTAPPVTDDSVRFTCKVLTNYGGLASGGNCTYTLKADRTTLQSGRKKIDAFGEISFSLPRKMVLDKSIHLEAAITRDKNKQTIQTAVPLLQQTAYIKLYPEGGNLVQGHPSATGIEIKNGAGVPIATRGQLQADGKLVAAFQTDLLGQGIIRWIPNPQARYTITIDNPGLQVEYAIPPIAATGHSLFIPEPVVNDTTLLIEIWAPGPGTCHLVAHNYRQSFFTGALRMEKEKAYLRLSTADMPAGVTTLTLFDEAGTPRAERAVYIKKQQTLQVQLSTDSASYHHRSKLQLKVKITGQQGKPVKALFSLACVLASRLDTTRAADIVRFQQFDRFLPSPANLPGIHHFKSDQQIEQLLLTRYWTRYKWDLIHTAKPYTPRPEKNCNIGYVYQNERPVKKPVQLMVISGKGTFTLDTDSTGYFELPSQVLQVESGKKAIILVSDTKHFKEYQVKLTNTCGHADTTLSLVNWPPAGYQQAELTVQEQEHLKKSLKAVVVTAKKNDYFSSVYKSTNCNDWVCMFNILNCRNHPTGSQPVDGMQYTYLGRQVTYQGCKGEEIPGFMQQINGASFAKEFYVADYDKFNPTEPELMSTLYWNYQVVTDEQGQATLHFSTNDLNGRFVCVLQGYSQEGAISAKTFFKIIQD